jgi:hypothetical protein
LRLRHLLGGSVSRRRGGHAGSLLLLLLWLLQLGLLSLRSFAELLLLLLLGRQGLTAGGSAARKLALPRLQPRQKLGRGLLLLLARQLTSLLAESRD